MLFLVRHGQTAENARGLLLGRQDPPLSETGRAQAAALARVLPAAAVVSSPLLRARQTAEALGLPVAVDDRWIELDYGELDGRRPGEVDAKTWSRWRADTAFAPPGGESLLDVGRRVRAACEELAANAAGDDVIVVSHVSPIKAAVAWALGVDDGVAWRMFVLDGSIARVAIGERGPLLTGFNEVPPPDV